MNFRIKRSPYWVGVIAVTAISWLAFYFFEPQWIAGFIVLACCVLLVLLAFARCRDAGEPSWLSLLAWIPLFGSGILLVIGVKPSVWREGDLPVPVDRRQPG